MLKDWENATIVLILKNGEKLTAITCDVVYKTVATLTERRIEPLMELQIGEYQADF